MATSEAGEETQTGKPLDELERLANLRDRGALTDGEFQKLKAVTLSNVASRGSAEAVYDSNYPFAMTCPGCGTMWDLEQSETDQHLFRCGDCGLDIDTRLAVRRDSPEWRRQLADTAEPYVTFDDASSDADDVDTYDAPNEGYAVLGFFFPIVGLILYLVWRDQTPLRAGSAGKGALIGVILSMVAWAVYAVFVGTLMASF